VLDDTPLREIVACLLPGNEWQKTDDPYTKLQYRRQGSEDAH